MDNENRVKPSEEETLETSGNPTTPERVKRGGLQKVSVRRYIRYVVFLVGIGLFYIWQSHVAEKQVRRQNKLKKEIADAKAEYKTMQARLSAGIRRPVIQAQVDSLGLKATSKNTYKLFRD